jgi:hypothetical protein
VVIASPYGPAKELMNATPENIATVSVIIVKTVATIFDADWRRLLSGFELRWFRV